MSVHSLVPRSQFFWDGEKLGLVHTVCACAPITKNRIFPPFSPSQLKEKLDSAVQYSGDCSAVKSADYIILGNVHARDHCTTDRLGEFNESTAGQILHGQETLTGSVVIIRVTQVSMFLGINFQLVEAGLPLFHNLWSSNATFPSQRFQKTKRQVINTKLSLCFPQYTCSIKVKVVQV